MTKIAVLVRAKDEDPAKGVEIKLQRVHDASISASAGNIGKVDVDLELASVEDARSLHGALAAFITHHDARAI